jgi:hypothetical protein
MKEVRSSTHLMINRMECTHADAGEDRSAFVINVVIRSLVLGAALDERRFEAGAGDELSFIEKPLNHGTVDFASRYARTELLGSYIAEEDFERKQSSPRTFEHAVLFGDIERLDADLRIGETTPEVGTETSFVELLPEPRSNRAPQLAETREKNRHGPEIKDRDSV